MLCCKANTLACHRDENKWTRLKKFSVWGAAPVTSSSMDDYCSNIILLLPTPLTESAGVFSPSSFFFFGQRVVNFKYVAHGRTHRYVGVVMWIKSGMCTGVYRIMQATSREAGLDHVCSIFWSIFNGMKRIGQSLIIDLEYFYISVCYKSCYATDFK